MKTKTSNAGHTGHTPVLKLPLHIDPNGYEGPIFTAGIADENGVYISDGGFTKPVAAFIVRAVNSHEKLLAALKRFLQYGDVFLCRTNEKSPYEQAKEAITCASAQGLADAREGGK